MTTLDSRLTFSNLDAETGKPFLVVDIQWSGVPPLFVDVIGDSIFDAIGPRLKAFRALAAEARSQVPAS